MPSNLTSGIYTVPDASRILGIPGVKLRRWLDYNSDSGVTEEAPNRYGLNQRGFRGEGREKHLFFLSLIELFTIAKLRDLGVSFPTIRRARDELAQRHAVAYPFANRDILVDGRKLMTIDSDLLVELGTNGQVAFRKVIEPFCNKVDFEESTALAQRFYPAGRESAVVVDPRLSFGRPVVAGTSITTEALHLLYKGGEAIETIAEQYELSGDQVSDALQFEHRAVA